MLPPLNLSDAKGSFFSRKRVDGRGATGSSGASSLNNARPSPRTRLLTVSSPRPTPTRDGSNSMMPPRSARVCPPGSSTSQPPVLTEMSLIPREFFVVETNAVLPPKQYPPTQYQSTLAPDGTWDTVVFPALTPHNRQQVLYLRQTLDKMRAAIPRLEDEEHARREGPEIEMEKDASVADERRRLVLEYTESEIRVCSFCFHELTRQIKCICKEQSELLLEIRQRYDDAVARLVEQVKSVSQQNVQQRERLGDVENQLQQALEDNNQLAHRLKELEELEKAGPPSNIALKAYKRRISAAKQRSRVGSIDEEGEEEEDYESGSENDEVDEEEAKWRRQRRATASSWRPSLGGRKDSLLEVNMAAKRLQMAFQKYQSRKEQSRLTLQVEKGAAAMDIQRSYRGFRERKLALHRRAVVRTIMRRREEQAAVELMQANVRAYLLKRRHSAKRKGTRLSVPPPTILPESIQPATPSSEVAKLEESTVILDVPTLESSRTGNELPAVNVPTQSEVSEEPDGRRNARETLVRLLATFRELTSAISIFQRGEPHVSESEEGPSAGGDVADSDYDATSGDTLPQAPGLSTNVSNSSLFHASSPFADDDVQLFHQTIQQAQALVGSLCGVLGSVPEHNPMNSQANESSTHQEGNGSDKLDPEAELSTDHKMDTSEIDVGSDDETDFREGEQPEALPHDAPVGGSLFHQPNYSELHLDDNLWNSATYYPATAGDTEQANARLAQVLASREQRKRLVSLKQFISDIYDTIVGKLQEQPAKHLATTITSRCSLALSFTEWKEQRAQICSRAATADQPSEMADGMNFNIYELAREHFRCKLGLKQLADTALKNLRENIDAFAAIDSDVKRFHEFLTRERSEEELFFYCVCRYLCAQCLSNGGTASLATVSSSTSDHRYPVFHPVTMREVIDLPHALELAKLLFRVDDEHSIVRSDLPSIEVENAVYQQYLPTNGYHQYEAIASRFFVDADCWSIAKPTVDKADDAEVNGALTCGQRPPESPPRHPGGIVRPTNYNQFHVKQYNNQAARSPLVRRQHQQRTSQLLRVASPAAIGEADVKWVFFEEVIELLLKYRGQMNHFHLFAHWVQELFSLAAARTTRLNGSGPPAGLRGVQSPPSEPKLLDEAAFVETLLPLSLGPTERELRNIFHNSLRQRRLPLRMPLRVFTSVALLLLRNGLLSVSNYAPLESRCALSDANGGSSSSNGARGQRLSSIRIQNDDREWRELALKWRVQEPAFEAAIEAIYHDEEHSFSVTPHAVSHDSEANPALLRAERSNAAASDSRSRSARALQLLQLRQELYDLFANRSGRGQDLQRAREVYELLVEERLARVVVNRGSGALGSDVFERRPSSQGSWTPVYTFI